MGALIRYFSELGGGFIKALLQTRNTLSFVQINEKDLAHVGGFSAPEFRQLCIDTQMSYCCASTAFIYLNLYCPKSL